MVVIESQTAEMKTLVVEMLGGVVARLEVPADGSIACVKQMLATKLNIPASEQRILVESAELGNEDVAPEGAVTLVRIPVRKGPKGIERLRMKEVRHSPDETSGSTWAGTPWRYSSRRFRDCEDNDFNESFALGELRITHDDDCGRDFASNSYAAHYGKTTLIWMADERGRGITSSGLAIHSGSYTDLDACLARVAELEGVSVNEFISFLPIKIPSGVPVASEK
eukprot:gnl/MRDRNA2_/MRDRNA2_110573_c0_seq1.p1 gnl/MRDRNA2_/MRDRNA2_110573_c0~~gnl/MRDRNA2_/MRDRNA2_110573_c0_seq1.p1  ORF type:complete len:224 (-),score=25.89 gnl/MRDRNA2_/MRDRNA2_110573_c0_seq1:119-790(-)